MIKKSISKQVERKTYLKGRFNGQFIEHLDSEKSDKNHERFFNLEILSGEILTEQQNITKLMDDEENHKFKIESKFITRLPEKISVTLVYLDGSIQCFKIKLRELKLINCFLSKRIYKGNKVFGRIEGDVYGYILHLDTVKEELITQADEKDGNMYWWLAKLFKSGLTKRIVGMTALCLLSIALILSVTYYQVKQKTKKQADEQEKDAAALKQSNLQRKDSFDLYYGEAIDLQKNNNTDSSLKKLETAAHFASIHEIALIKKARLVIFRERADKLIKEKKYPQAILAYTDLIAIEPSNTEFLYQRAVCYKETKNIQESVTDLKRAIALGDKPSLLLHNKINPIHKKIVGYITRCCDGTTSSASGRGACSYHGGVCDWNEPLYEESRDYE